MTDTSSTATERVVSILSAGHLSRTVRLPIDGVSGKNDLLHRIRITTLALMRGPCRHRGRMGAIGVALA